MIILEERRKNNRQTNKIIVVPLKGSFQCRIYRQRKKSFDPKTKRSADLQSKNKEKGAILDEEKTAEF